MIGRNHRFHGYNSVLPVYRQATQVRADGCSLHYRLNPKKRDYRLAVVVSKKVEKSAVKRNRIRRRVFETVRTTITIDQPYDLIITVFDADIATQPAEKVTKTVTSLFQKSGIYSR